MSDKPNLRLAETTAVGEDDVREVRAFVDAAHFHPESIIFDSEEYEIMRNLKSAPELPADVRATVADYVRAVTMDYKKDSMAFVEEVTSDQFIPPSELNDLVQQYGGMALVKELFIQKFAAQEQMLYDLSNTVQKLKAEANTVEFDSSNKQQIRRRLFQWLEQWHRLHLVHGICAPVIRRVAMDNEEILAHVDQIDMYFSVNMSHDINNDLEVVINNLELFLSDRRGSVPALSVFDNSAFAKLKLLPQILAAERFLLSPADIIEHKDKDERRQEENMRQQLNTLTNYLSLRFPDYQFVWLDTATDSVPQPGKIELVAPVDWAIDRPDINFSALIVILYNAIKNSILVARDCKKIIPMLVNLTYDSTHQSWVAVMKDSGPGFPTIAELEAHIQRVAGENSASGVEKSLLIKMLQHPVIKQHLPGILLRTALFGRGRQSSFRQGGTGVGLNKMYNLTAAMHGVIELLDVPTGGAEVRIAFPADPASTPSGYRVRRLSLALREIGYPISEVNADRNIAAVVCQFDLPTQKERVVIYDETMLLSAHTDVDGEVCQESVSLAA